MKSYQSLMSGSDSLHTMQLRVYASLVTIAQMDVQNKVAEPAVYNVCVDDLLLQHRHSKQWGCADAVCQLHGTLVLSHLPEVNNTCHWVMCLCLASM